MPKSLRVQVTWFSAWRPFLDAPVDTVSAADPRTRKGFNSAMPSAIDAIDRKLVIVNAYGMYPGLDMRIPAGGKPAHGAVSRDGGHLSVAGAQLLRGLPEACFDTIG